MKMIILMIAAMLSVSISLVNRAAAQQSGDIYWGLAAAPYWTHENESGDDDVEFDTGFAASGQLGYIFDIVRTEIEFEFSRSDIDEIGGDQSDSDLQTYRVAASLLFDCNEGGPLFFVPCDSLAFTPYVGLGLGVARQELNGDLNDDKTSLTAHGDVGISFASNRQIEFGLGYRFEWFEGRLDGLDSGPTSSQLRLGARFFY